MSSGKTEKIYGINGPVIYLKGKTDFKMSEMVHVGEEKLVGEVISLDKDRTTVQVYEAVSYTHLDVYKRQHLKSIHQQSNR